MGGPSRPPDEEMLRPILITALLLALTGPLLLPVAAQGGPRCDNCPNRSPYGDYCDGPRWGRYGARTEVASAADARKIIADYFAGQDVTIGPLQERRMFFEAEIRDRQGNVVDRVIVHRRSGRIRSIN